MTKTELLKTAKPILFNTDMVKAILDGRKTVTRRVVKYYSRTPTKDGRDKFYKIDENLNGTNPNRLYAGFYNNNDIFYIDGEKHIDALYYPLYFKVGDILYVRETWYYEEHMHDDPDLPSEKYLHRYIYKASNSNYPVNIGVGKHGWKPSIHMPKEAARIFLKVTDVGVERLQDITAEQIDAEGCKEYGYNAKTGKLMPSRPTWFKIIWDNTIKKQDLDKYGWDTNPWVWVYEFEREENDG